MRMAVEGRLPGKVLCGARASASASDAPLAINSAWAWASVLPCIRACPWARALAHSGASEVVPSVEATMTNSAGTTCGP